MPVAGRWWYSALHGVTVTLPVSQMPPTENQPGQGNDWTTLPEHQSSGLPGVNLQGRETFEGSGLEEAGLQLLAHHAPSHHRPFACAVLPLRDVLTSPRLSDNILLLVLLSQRRIP